jgi:hypothetical protein
MFKIGDKVYVDFPKYFDPKMIYIVRGIYPDYVKFEGTELLARHNQILQRIKSTRLGRKLYPNNKIENGYIILEKK